MSAPRNQAIDSENLKYSFMAARAEETLNKKLGNNPLSDEDIRILSDAHLFLKTLAEGAELVQTGHYRGHNSRKSMRALRIAMNPLKSLSEANDHPDVKAYFESLANALEPKSIRNGKADRVLIHNAELFFESLYEYLVNAVGRNRQKERLFLPRRKGIQSQ